MKSPQGAFPAVHKSRVCKDYSAHCNSMFLPDRHWINLDIWLIVLEELCFPVSQVHHFQWTSIKGILEQSPKISSNRVVFSKSYSIFMAFNQGVAAPSPLAVPFGSWASCCFSGSNGLQASAAHMEQEDFFFFAMLNLLQFSLMNSFNYYPPSVFCSTVGLLWGKMCVNTRTKIILLNSPQV